MYKAVFIDIDGTLLNSDLEISSENKLAIEKAKEKGIRVFITSGRSRMSAISFEEYTDQYMINSNGAEIYDCTNKDLLFQATIDEEVCKKMYEIALERDLLIKFDFGLGRAANKKEYLEYYEMELTESIDEFLSKYKIVQIALCSESIDEINEIKEYINNNLNLQTVNQFIWNVNDKSLHSIHCTRPNVSKGNAMIGLCKYLKLDLKDVVAIGDKVNDISMIKEAGLGVAMGNALENVKNSADFVTSTNNENGVAKVLNMIMEEK